MISLARSVGDAVRQPARRLRFRDGLITFDNQTKDSAGSFLLSELERLDQQLHMPLAAVTYFRDIDLREDVTMGDEFSSFTNSSFSAPGGIPGSNKNWISKTANAIPGIGLDIGKTITGLPIWGMELSWSLPELASAIQLGRSVDQQKYEGMQLKYQMDIDEQVYIGDTVLGFTGMLNQTNLTNVGNAVTGTWATATAAQILADVNELLTSVWTTSGTALAPDRLLLAPTEYTLLLSSLVSTAGNISLLEFIKNNSLSNAINGKPLEIFPCKWLVGTGNTFGGVAGKGPTATNSMYAYRKEKRLIRFPLVPLQRTPLEWRSINQLTTYYGRLGGVELVYGETAGRRSNLK